MSERPPPFPDVSEFNNLYWQYFGSSLNIAEMDGRYLKFPVSQGSETINGQLDVLGQTVVSSAGIKFNDGTLQTTAGSAASDPDLATVLAAGNNAGNYNIDMNNVRSIENVFDVGSQTITASGLISGNHLTATSGDIVATNGNITANSGNILVSGGDITATIGDIVASSGDITATTGIVSGAVVNANGVNLGSSVTTINTKLQNQTANSGTTTLSGNLVLSSNSNLNVGSTIDSISDKVQNITANSTITLSEKTFRQFNTAALPQQITLNDYTVFIEGPSPGIKMYRNDRPSTGPSFYIIAGPDGEMQLQNFQTNKNILLATATGSSSAEIKINSNSVKINGVDANTKFNQVTTNTTNTQNLSAIANTTYSEGTFRQSNTSATTLKNVILNDGNVFISGPTPGVNLYKTDNPGGTILSAYINVDANEQFEVTNYQQDKNILITTAAGSTSAAININSNSVRINGVDVDTKFNQVTTNTTNTQNLSAVTGTTYSEGLFRQLNPDPSTTDLTEITMNQGKITIEGIGPELTFNRHDRTGSGPSGYINVSANGQFNMRNYQENANLLISTAGGSSTTARIDINSNSVYINGVDANTKFNQVTTNANDISTLQTQLIPTATIVTTVLSTAPAGWYICDGSVKSQLIDVDLWNAIGNTFLNGRPPPSGGVGNPFFYLPDMRELYVKGAASNSTYSPSGIAQHTIGTYLDQSFQNHKHHYDRPNQSTTVGGLANPTSKNVLRNSFNTSQTTSGALEFNSPNTPYSNGMAETRPFSMVLNYMIKR